jgi:hypothetical protein
MSPKGEEKSRISKPRYLKNYPNTLQQRTAIDHLTFSRLAKAMSPRHRIFVFQKLSGKPVLDPITWGKSYQP